MTITENNRYQHFCKKFKSATRTTEILRKALNKLGRPSKNKPFDAMTIQPGKDAYTAHFPFSWYATSIMASPMIK